MSDAVVPPIEVPKPKRKYTRRKKVKAPRVPKIAGTVKPEPTAPVLPPPRPRYGAPKALEEVDRQLATAISQKPAYHEQLSTLFSQTALTQQRLERLNQQIQELVNLQRQLDGEQGVTASTGVTFGPMTVPRNVASLVDSVSAPMFGEVPAGVGSIPAKQPAPNPGGNVAGDTRAMGDPGWK
jgi:hypothetical protein